MNSVIFVWTKFREMDTSNVFFYVLTFDLVPRVGEVPQVNIGSTKFTFSVQNLVKMSYFRHL